MNNQNFYLTRDDDKKPNNNSVRIPTYNELFEPILFDPDGTRSADDWLARFLIYDLAELHLMTAGQLFRWIHRSAPKKSIEKIRDFVAALFRHKFIGKMIVEIPVSQSKRIRTDQNELKKTPIIFLTHNCQPIAGEIRESFARYGPPTGLFLNRIYHDLLITEAVLYIGESYYINCLKNEARIKSELQKGKNLDGQSVADFHVLLDYRVDKNAEIELKSVAGEVIVQSDSKDISGKPEGTIFFTANQRAADLIQKLRKERVFLLGDVSLPALAEAHLRDAHDAIFDPAKLLLREKIRQLREHKLLDNADYSKIIYALYVNGPLTEGAFVALLNLKRANISKKLNVLVRNKILHSEDVQFSPGEQIGRPKRIFAFTETDLSSYQYRVQQLKKSLSLISQS